ncbi:MAG: phosphodiesterase [Betaproteobacteria bacterium]|nr:phosphodiesterase [Betaproteobacteria bacterium]
MTTFLYQITDLHIREPGRLAYGRLHTAPYLQRAIETVQSCPQPPTAVVLTGDLTDFGRPEEYAHLRELLAPLTCPVYLLAGNHDDPAQMRLSFPDHGYLGTQGALQYSVPVGDLQLIALDTTTPRQSHGTLCETRLQWLEEALEAARDRPVVIAMHHPPFTTLIGHMDKIGLLSGGDELAQLVSRHPNVERVICGHLHRAIDVRFAGTLASTCPAPAHQVVLDLHPDAASQWNLEPGGFRIHAWQPGTGLISHTRPVGAFEGPYPFHMGGALID